MTLRTSRRRAMQAALASAATVTLPHSRAAAQQATSTAGSEAAITAAQVQSAVDRLERLIEDGMTLTGVPGTAVAVVYADEVVYERGFGVRELGKPEPITPGTVFQIASLSKSLSSTWSPPSSVTARPPGTPRSAASSPVSRSPTRG